jgi:ribonucleoside-diphosphate reductase alpha chain
MDTSNWIPDLFMMRVQADGDWTLFSPDETPELHHIYGREFKEKYEEYEAKAARGEIRLHKKLKARDLWRRMITMLFETGHPWMTWKDACNVRSPQDHVGVVHNSNLCTEITLNTSADETAVCNLGSVNIARHIIDGKLDQEMLRETIHHAMRMLDNVIDLNFYPTKEAKVSNFRHRPVGLGIMGTQDALYMLDIPFDSEEAVRFADTSMEAISYYAILGSSELARERGRYPTYKGSKWDRGIFPIDTIALLEEERGMTIPVDRSCSMDWTPVREHVKKYGMRNSNTMAIAPTATISTINGSVPSIEPIYKNIYVKSNQTGDFIIVNEALVIDLKKLGLWDYEMLGKVKYHDGNISAIDEIPQHIKDKYKETFDIDPRWCIKQAAYRGKWIDQSQSFNIFYGGKSGKEINDIYLYAWEMGLKTTYYLRTLGASQVEKSTVDTQQHGSTHERKSFNASVTDARAAQATASAANSPVSVPESSPMVMGPDGKEIKLCKLNDPGCESCQ